MNDLELVTNEYNEPATHFDCVDNGVSKCDGEMEYYTSRTGLTMLRCHKHLMIAYNRQDKIRKEYNLSIAD